MKRTPTFCPPGGGRVHDLGPRVGAVFLADDAEAGAAYSISEWWLEPGGKGPGSHQHEEDDVFYVLEGTMSFMLGDRWVDAPRGSLVIAPAGTPHDFQNRGTVRAGALNISVPGGFEEHMPGIAAWFRDRDGGPKPT